MYRNVKRPIIVNGSADDSLEKYVEHIQLKLTLHTQEETYEGFNNNQSPIALTLIDRCQRPSPQPKLGQQPQLVNEWTERTAACQSIQRTAKSTGCTIAVIEDNATSLSIGTTIAAYTHHRSVCAGITLTAATSSRPSPRELSTTSFMVANRLS